MSSAMKSSVPNPYEPPALVESETVSILPVLPEDRWCELDVQLVSFHRGWCERRILLGGSIPADIEYDPIGYGERVLVDGRMLVHTSPWGWGWETVQPHIDFQLKAFGYAIPASIDVKVSILRLLKTVVFRLTVAGKVVYEE